MIHELKIKSRYFRDIKTGKKKFEVRRNDRGYTVGDYLALNELNENHELDPKEPMYTGSCMIVEISYILDEPEYLRPGYVVLGIDKCNFDI